MYSRRSFVRTAASALFGFLGIGTASKGFGVEPETRTGGHVTEVLAGPNGQITVVAEYDTDLPDNPNAEVVLRKG